MTSKNRRNSKQPSDKELYKKDVDSFIKQERRRDELERLNEIKEQKSVWLKTMIFCGGLNVLLILLSIVGMFI